MTDHEYKILLDAKEVIRKMRDDRAIRKEAIDCHATLVLLMAAYSDARQAQEELRELVMPF